MRERYNALLSEKNADHSRRRTDRTRIGNYSRAAQPRNHPPPVARAGNPLRSGRRSPGPWRESHPASHDASQYSEEPGTAEQRGHSIHGALKQRGIFMVLGMELGDRPNGLVDMSRKDR